MGSFLNDSAVMMCPHGGSVKATTSNTRTKAGGGFMLRSSDTFLISGCPLNISGSPHPCIQVNWVQTAMKSTVGSNPTLTDESRGMCVAADQAAQGSVQITFTQSKVSGK